jgi:cytochrome b subunit of formate dehydrogenase
MTAILGLVTAISGLYLSFSLSRAIGDLGNGLMVLGVLVAFVAIYFYSAIARS